MHKYFTILFLALSMTSYAQNTKLVGTVDLLGSKTLSVYADGSGVIGIRLPEGSLNLDYADLSNFARYFILFDSFTDKVKSGNNVSYSGFLGGNAFTPYLPSLSKVFVEVSTHGTYDSCSFSFRVVHYANKGGWGNDPTFSLNVEQLNKLRSILSEAKSTDGDIQSKLAELQTIATSY
jgi:hypothetical protein